VDRLNATQARYCAAPLFAANNGKKETAAQANGRRYDEKVTMFLQQWAKGNGYKHMDHPWIQYFSEGGQLKWCQPDALLLSERDDNLLVIEIKYRHTRDAFHQMARYCPLIAELHPKFRISQIEICRYFDSTEFATTLFPSLRPHNLPHAAVVWEPLDYLLFNS
jgi:hypothetical protein